MPKSLYVKDIINNQITDQQVSGRFLLSSKSLGTGKNGSYYLSLKLTDKTGDIDAKKWDVQPNEADKYFEGKVYEVKGTVSQYNGSPQVKVDKLTRVDEEFDPADYMKSSPRDPEEMLGELKALTDTITAPPVKCLVDYFFGNREFVKKFRVAPAAISMHHGYVSGLLEHTLQVAKTGAAIAEQYPGVNRDLVLGGCLLHDIAKTAEYSWESNIEFTTEGHLLGHLYMGAQMVRKACEELQLDRDFAMYMEHMILSHHGKYEWGSPKRPKSPEAIILFIADYTSASITQARDAIGDANARNEKGDFTSKPAKSLERRLYRKDPLSPASAGEQDDSVFPEDDKPVMDAGSFRDIEDAFLKGDTEQAEPETREETEPGLIF
ncbi:MAG: HD domain-containing protein [Abditibacteriota bacterium]|nr:HD domain-containing protein [Abditibacteriota bacterium]